MFNSIDFWDHRAATQGIRLVTEAMELDEAFADLLTGQSDGYGVESDLRDQPELLCEEAAPYNEQEEVDRLLDEREERDLQRQIDDWEEQSQLVWYDSLLIERRLQQSGVNGDFPQEHSESWPHNGPAPSSDQAIARKTSNGFPIEPDPVGSGGFPQKHASKPTNNRPCTPTAAGLLSIFHIQHESTLAVLRELQTKEPCTDLKIKDEIRRRAAALDFQRKLVRSIASRVSLPDWERRLPSATKRAFALLALARHPDARSFTFRLGHEVVEAALQAKHGPTDYLARILQRLGVAQAVFVLERTTSQCDENNPYHIHGVAIIRADLLNELIREKIGPNGKPEPSKLRAALAPPPSKKTTPPVRGYRQRYTNKAIDIQLVRTASAWRQYITKDIDLTAHELGARPDYASRSATQAGKALYKSIRDAVTAVTQHRLFVFRINFS